jgi:hypothetical protein
LNNVHGTFTELRPEKLLSLNSEQFNTRGRERVERKKERERHRSFILAWNNYLDKSCVRIPFLPV